TRQGFHRQPRIDPGNAQAGQCRAEDRLQGRRRQPDEQQTQSLHGHAERDHPVAAEARQRIGRGQPGADEGDAEGAQTIGRVGPAQAVEVQGDEGGQTAEAHRTAGDGQAVGQYGEEYAVERQAHARQQGRGRPRAGEQQGQAAEQDDADTDAGEPQVIPYQYPEWRADGGAAIGGDTVPGHDLRGACRTVQADGPGAAGRGDQGRRDALEDAPGHQQRQADPGGGR